jgi:hypothetical protein
MSEEKGLFYKKRLGKPIAGYVTNSITVNISNNTCIHIF